MSDVAQGWVAFLSSSKKSREWTSQPIAFPAAGKMGPLVMRGIWAAQNHRNACVKSMGIMKFQGWLSWGKAMDFLVLTNSSRRPVGGSKELSRCYSGASWGSRSLVNSITWEEIAGCPQESRLSLVAPGWLIIYLQRGRLGFSPCIGKIPWGGQQPTPVFFPWESPRAGSLERYVHRVSESNMTEQLHSVRNPSKPKTEPLV